MKEDVLEQIVVDYLQMEGYFTTHNVRFKPSPDQEGYESGLDSVSSDVDVVGFHPKRGGHERVAVVSCKAWQTGFRADQILAQLRGEAKNPKRQRWLQFRELWNPKWADAFIREIETLTGSDQFTYYLAVTQSEEIRRHGKTTARSNRTSEETRSGSCRLRPCGRGSSPRSRPRLPRARWDVLRNS